MAVALLAAIPALAGEYAVLKNGFQIHADRHEKEGDIVRLYTGPAVLEFPAPMIARFEADDFVPTPEPGPAPAPAPPVVDPKDLLRQAALRHGLPPELLLSIAAVESGYRQEAQSPKGAIGLMQLMPETARELKADPADPGQNADAGARYLRRLLLKYLSDPYQVRKALAAYNAGPGAVDRYGGIPPYAETLRYVQRVLDQHKRLSGR